MRLWSKNKKTPLVLKSILLILFGTFLFLPKSTFAAWNPLTAIFGGVVEAIIPIFVVPLALVLIISEGLAKLAGFILDIVIDPFFLKDVGYTKNPLIDIGLSITQEFVNLFLVVALVYIAVSIALRLANEAQAKKMLFRLIFIALIVNFAPVICGIIVDASNILMNYFLKGVGGGVSGFLSVSTIGGGEMLTHLLSLSSLEGQLSFLTRLIVQVCLNISVFIIFLLFAFIFLLRYLWIWVLVILAPLAFVSVIIPQTRVLIWDRWWDKFIEWCFIGIPAAFFLYLGARFFELIPELRIVDYISSETTGIERSLTGFFLGILPYIMVAVFFYLGFIASLSVTNKGKQTLFSLYKTKGKPFARKVSNVVRGIPGVQKAEEEIRTKLETTPLLGRIVGGPGAFEREKRKEFEVAYKSLAGIPVPTLEKRLSQPVTNRKQRFERAAIIQHLLEKEAFDETKHGKYVAEALILGLKKSDLYKRRPDLAKTFLNMRIKDVMRNILPSEVPKIHARAFKNVSVAAHVALDSAKFDKLAREGSTEAKKVFKETLLHIPTPQKGRLKPRLVKVIAKIGNDPRFPK